MSSRVRDWLRHLFSPQGFRGPVLTLLSGSTVVMVIAYAAQIVLARLYTAAEFGLSDYFVSIMVVLISFTSLRYEDALMVPEEDEDAASVFWLALVVLGAFTTFFCLLLPWREPIAAFLGVPDIAPWLLLVPPTLLAMRIAKVSEVWLVRTKQFRDVTAGQVSSTLAMVSTRIGAGVPPVNAGAGGLIGGFFAGQLTAFLVFGTILIRQQARVLRRAFRWQRIWAAARRFRRFPLFSTPSTLLASVVTRLPFLLIPVYFDETVVGYFGRAFTVLAIPLSLIGGAVSQVFFVHAAEAQREERLEEVTHIVHKRLVMLGLFPTLVLLLAGPDVFDFVLGSPWRPAGQYVQYVGLWLFLASVASPLTRLFDVLERQRLDLLMSLLMFVTLAIAMIAGGRSGDVWTMLLYIGIAGVVARLIHLGVLLHLAAVSFFSALRAYGRYLLFSLPGLLLVGAVLRLESPLITTAAAVVAGLLYVGLVLWQDRLLAVRPDAPSEE
jgi:O-antigen/teichoic acid export membrane protein